MGDIWRKSCRTLFDALRFIGDFNILRTALCFVFNNLFCELTYSFV